MAAFQNLVRFAVGDRAHYRGLIEAVDGKYNVQRFDGTPFDGVVKTNEEHEVETLLSPIENTPNVIYIGLNYKAHAQESKLPVPTYPPVFTKPADALAGPFEKIEIHPDAQPLLDYEGELTVIIRQRCQKRDGGGSTSDIAGCFGTGNFLLPVHVGGCAGLALGIPVEVYEPSVDSKGVPDADGEAGDLVATAAFPIMPVSFWGQDGNKRYHKAYFAEFDGVWTHGDFVSIHPITKQLFFHGRADGVLNPSGVRFGSSEIYQVIESVFSSEVEDSLCVGQRRPSDNDERVILFLKMKPNAAFSTELARRVRAAVRKRLSARHVPSYVFPTPEIPVTVNFKKVELPVKKIISGIHIQPSSTLAYPECLDYYAQYFDIEKMAAGESKL
ncbi:hypothetical protein AFLA_012664 [Aspergillus flavus NRRL3357]|nr:hypothetical protein AFLA_012664 [Aspergillus flavus NRRL3357]